MKVHHTSSELLIVGAGAEHKARIKESSKAFHILSGALYSDKILAVVRELSCNAYDAHVQAGRADVPFEVRLPSYMDQTFYVKDYGTGLSEEQIYNLYMVYFESTKQESDDYVGQLGLGCKSPFSYGSTFTVESRQGGIKKVYTCYKNADMVPAVTKMAEAATDEVDGLTVTIAVRDDDMNRFYHAARYALMYFAVPPKVTGWSGFTPFDVKYSLEGGNWKVRSNDSIYKGPRVVQGAISYPIDMKLVGETLNLHGDETASNRWAEMISIWSNANLDLFVKIGEVEIAPSREALTYDTRTALNLVKAFEQALDELMDTIINQVGQTDTQWEMHLKINSLREQSAESIRQIITHMQREGRFEHEGSPVYEHIRIGEEINDVLNGEKPTPGLIEWTPNNIRVTWGGTRYKGTPQFNPQSRGWPISGKQLSVRPRAGVVFVVDDVWTHRRMTPKMLAKLIDTKRLEGVFVVQSTVDGEPVTDQAELDQLVAHLGYPEVIMVSELERPESSGYTYRKKERNELPVWRGVAGISTSKWSPKMWRNESIELTDGGYYIPIERYTIAAGTSSIEDSDVFDKTLAQAKAHGLLPSDMELVGIPKNRVDYVKQHGNWINIFDAIAEAAKDQSLIAQVKESHKNWAVRAWLPYNGVVSAMVASWSLLRLEVKNQAMLNFMDDIYAAYNALNRQPADLLVPVGVLKRDELESDTRLRARWLDALGDNHQNLSYIQVPSAMGTSNGRRLIAAALNGML